VKLKKLYHNDGENMKQEKKKTREKNLEETPMVPSNASEETIRKRDQNKTEISIPTEEKKKTLNGFDMSEFIAQPLETGIVIERKIINVPAKKPNSQQFFRIHPSEEVLVDVVDWKDEGVLYLVRQSALPALMEQTKRIILYLGILRTGTPFLFPVPQPDSSGKWNSWHRSASEAVIKAKEHWVRIQPDKPSNGYILYEAEGKIPDPEWPDMTIIEYLAIAFKDAIIADANHPFVKSLKGEK
jgi:hypothetical protein